MNQLKHKSSPIIVHAPVARAKRYKTNLFIEHLSTIGISAELIPVPFSMHVNAYVKEHGCSYHEARYQMINTSLNKLNVDVIIVDIKYIKEMIHRNPQLINDNTIQTMADDWEASFKVTATEVDHARNIIEKRKLSPQRKSELLKPMREHLHELITTDEQKAFNAKTFRDRLNTLNKIHDHEMLMVELVGI